MHLTFQPVQLDLQEDYLTMLSKCGQIPSDYSFTNLYGWAPEYGLQCCKGEKSGCKASHRILQLGGQT